MLFITSQQVAKPTARPASVSACRAVGVVVRIDLDFRVERTCSRFDVSRDGGAAHFRANVDDHLAEAS
jgi:hypothetical protein